MKSQSVVTDLRKQIFTEIARVAYESEDILSDIEAIPYIITPDEENPSTAKIFTAKDRLPQSACA